jgi:hypothetical protein
MDNLIIRIAETKGSGGTAAGTSGLGSSAGSMAAVDLTTGEPTNATLRRAAALRQ